VTTPAELLQPDARWRSVLAGETGFAPPAFEGLAGVTVVDGVASLIIGSTDGTALVVSGGRVAQPETAVADLAVARIEWTDGLLPQGSSTDWSGRTRFAVARIVAGGAPIATLTVAPLTASLAAMAGVVTAVTGIPAFAVLGGESDLEAPRGTALGHATIAALEALPPAGQELYLDRVVESGAPLAVWRPRPALPGDRTLDVASGAWQLGAVVVRLDADGYCTAVELPAGPYAG
jgi:hypothetical protein